MKRNKKPEKIRQKIQRHYSQRNHAFLKIYLRKLKVILSKQFGEISDTQYSRLFLLYLYTKGKSEN